MAGMSTTSSLTGLSRGIETVLLSENGDEEFLDVTGDETDILARVLLNSLGEVRNFWDNLDLINELPQEQLEEDAGQTEHFSLEVEDKADVLQEKVLRSDQRSEKPIVADPNEKKRKRERERYQEIKQDLERYKKRLKKAVERRQVIAQEEPEKHKEFLKQDSERKKQSRDLLKQQDPEKFQEMLKTVAGRGKRYRVEIKQNSTRHTKYAKKAAERHQTMKDNPERYNKVLEKVKKQYHETKQDPIKYQDLLRKNAERCRLYRARKREAKQSAATATKPNV